jgi:hypothetical protein
LGFDADPQRRRVVMSSRCPVNDPMQISSEANRWSDGRAPVTRGGRISTTRTDFLKSSAFHRLLLPKFMFEELDDLGDNRGKMPNGRLFGGLEAADNCVGLFGLQLDDPVHDNFSFRGSTLSSSAMVCSLEIECDPTRMRRIALGSHQATMVAGAAYEDGGGSTPTTGGFKVAVVSYLVPPTTALVSSIFSSMILFMALFPSEGWR